jgi:hypothetical protein
MKVEVEVEVVEGGPKLQFVHHHHHHHLDVVEVVEVDVVIRKGWLKYLLRDLE